MGRFGSKSHKFAALTWRNLQIFADYILALTPMCVGISSIPPVLSDPQQDKPKERKCMTGCQLAIASFALSSIKPRANQGEQATCSDAATHNIYLQHSNT